LADRRCRSSGASLNCYVTKPAAHPARIADRRLDPLKFGTHLLAEPAMVAANHNTMILTEIRPIPLCYQPNSRSWRAAAVAQIADIMRNGQETRGFGGAPDG